MTDLALAKYPDGSLPPTIDVVGLSTFLFAAGQETTVRVIGAMLRFLGEDPALQKRLRAERARIPDFVEETLRMESAVKSDFRLAKVRAKVGDVEMEPGTPVMMCIGAMNRDPRKFENPHTFQLDRKNARDHLAFARGIHSCIGAPLARAELKVTLERLFDRTADIRIDDTKHGPAGSRIFNYDPSFVVRGLSELYLTFTGKA
jgi:cytochrome P450